MQLRAGMEEAEPAPTSHPHPHPHPGLGPRILGRGGFDLGLKGVQCGWDTVGEGGSLGRRLRDRQGPRAMVRGQHFTLSPKDNH